MKTIMSSLADEYPQLCMDIFIGNMEGAACIARERFPSNYDVIISRGGTAGLLKEEGFPVIEVEISLYDILCALRLADGINGKIAMVVYANIAVSAKMLCDLLGYQIEIISVKNFEDLEPTLRTLSEQQYNTVLCDTIANSIAQRLGLNSILVTSGAESIRRAFNWASLLCRDRNRLLDECRFYQEILCSQMGQTVVLDEQGTVLFNTEGTVSEELLSILRQELQVPGQESTRRITRCLGGMAQLIRVRRIPVGNRANIAFCIEPRKVPVFPGQTGIRYLSRQDAETMLYESIFGFSGIINEYRRDIDRLSSGTTPVLITGEDGTGKDQMVSALYLRGPYTTSPLVFINCSALSDKSWSFLLEHHNSPLTDTKTTIFFSNADILSPARRHQLIEMFQELNVCRSNQVLISCSCSSDGQIASESTEFLNALGCLPLHLMPLRKMEKNIYTLVNLALGHLNIDQTDPVLGASPEAIRLLQEFSWPHNYTQFFRVIQELVSTTSDQIITAQTVSSALQKERYSGVFTPRSDGTAAPLDLNRTLNEISRDVAIRVLHETGDNQTAAAKRLGISRTTLWRLLRSETSQM